MLDQAQKLRQLAVEATYDEKQNDAPRIITVTSGKGGVGKSNFVVNLGITLQKLGKKVMIFDADVGMGNDDVLMGFLPKYNVFDVIFNNKEIQEVIISGPYGIKLLPGGSGITKIEDLTKEQRERFIHKLNELRGLDYILMDTGAGVNKNVLGFIACCEELILLATPEPTSITDAYSLLKAVDHFKIKSLSKIVINRVFNEEEAYNTFLKFNNAVNNFLKIKVEYLGSVSEDKKLVQSVRNQRPLVMEYPNSEASQDINKIAKKLVGTSSNEKQIGIQGLFKKIFSVFS